jgi:hypothetical protein
MKRTGFKRLSFDELIAKKRAAEERARSKKQARAGRKSRKAKKTPMNGKLRLWSSKEADKRFSRYIRARDGKCFFCPNEGKQNSHFWGRANSSTRYDPENNDAICGGCHMKHESQKQGLYREMKIAQLGEDGYRALEKRARSSMRRADAIRACMVLLAGTEFGE